ncbi:type VI secretion system protein TssA [Rhizobium rhizogenes]|uniref:Type VI secretion system protein TssA n=1 Tax=Rhizobium rhizogenes TaxID=359 RepID=A0AA88EWU0_RHIRH|nr:type VI secretion system protein TssA [Rhizobium rhizogenes]KAA3499334.1 type VI secretion system protein TssA [Rhizobium rhizogenes]
MNAPHVKRDIELFGDCGENIRIDSRTREIYYRIKDERNHARTEERAASPQDNLKISSSWDSVSNLGLQIIYSESKDIEILAWLAEASLRLRGFHGLREIYDLCRDLFCNQWDSLRSISDDNDEEKFAPLAGLNGIGSEGTLVQPLRLAPLIPGGKFAEHSLWDFQLAQRPNESKRREELYRAASEAGVAAMSSHLTEVTACLAAFDAITAVLSERCGQAAPPSSNIRNTLIEAAAAIRTLGGRDQEPAPVAQATAAVPGADEAGQPAARAPSASPEGISSRDEAFETLLSVARYFRRTEPHSPISLSIETLVRRGRMDFSELLAELLPETQARNAVLTAAGIKPGGENNGK